MTAHFSILPWSMHGQRNLVGRVHGHDCVTNTQRSSEKQEFPCENLLSFTTDEKPDLHLKDSDVFI